MHMVVSLFLYPKNVIFGTMFFFKSELHDLVVDIRSSQCIHTASGRFFAYCLKVTINQAF
uniref:Uncharacterized protein n=1 Tax=Arundo donax TaxID=35708 RepID=A0A0A9GXK4_ARUDO